MAKKEKGKELTAEPKEKKKGKEKDGGDEGKKKKGEAEKEKKEKKEKGEEGKKEKKEKGETKKEKGIREKAAEDEKKAKAAAEAKAKADSVPVPDESTKVLSKTSIEEPAEPEVPKKIKNLGADSMRYIGLPPEWNSEEIRKAELTDVIITQ
jgi:colicin import membrane protein